MAFGFGERWAPGDSVGPGVGARRAARARGGLAIAGVLAAIVLASQSTAPIQIAGRLGTSSSSAQHQGPPGNDARANLSNPTSLPTAVSTGPAVQATSTPTSLGLATHGTSAAASTAAHTSSDTTSPGPTTTPTSAPTTRPTSSPTRIAVTAGTPILAASGAPVYLHYYLWWTKRHWQDKLGQAYPYAADPLPLPGQTDPTGCNPTVSYAGATIVDIPSAGLQDQSLAATFDSHIATAVAFGITGFVADWAGTGAAGQTPGSSGYNARLDLLVQRVDAWNANHSQKFRLALDFAAFGNYNRPASAIISDLSYFSARYGGNEAFASAFSTHPLVMLIGSRQYPLATIQTVSAAARPSLFLLGDESYSTLSRDAAYLDGSSYYWSSESPSNSGAKAQIASLGSQLHGAGKPWFAPFTAGYDSVLIGGHCVPRNGLSTLDTIWSWNSASHPDAWFGISWNEYVENTYLEPSLQYGTTYLTEVARLAGH